MKEDLVLDTTQQPSTSDASRVLLMKCPIEGCSEHYRIAYRGYRQYYNCSKKVTTTEPKLGKSRWQLAAMTNHLLRQHTGKRNNKNNVDMHTNEQIQINIPSNNNSAFDAQLNLQNADNNLTDQQFIDSRTIALDIASCSNPFSQFRGNNSNEQVSLESNIHNSVPFPTTSQGTRNNNVTI